MLLTLNIHFLVLIPIITIIGIIIIPQVNLPVQKQIKLLGHPLYFALQTLLKNEIIVMIMFSSCTAISFIYTIALYLIFNGQNIGYQFISFIPN
jgi:hypothetical protein